MTVETLKTSTSAILSSEHAHMTVYVVVGEAEILMLDIERDDLDSLTEAFKASLTACLVNKDYSLQNYSQADNRTGRYFVFDLDEKPNTFVTMERAVNEHIETRFSLSEYNFSDVKGIIAVISDGHNQIITYKYFTQVEIIGGQKQYIFGFKSNRRIVQEKESMIRLTPKFDIVRVNNEFVILRLEVIEKMEESLTQIIVNESNRLANDLTALSLIANIDKFKELISDNIKITKKFIKASKESKVLYNRIPNSTIIQFIKDKRQKIGKITLTDDESQIEIQNKTEAERFLKILNDDLLTSGLTQLDYWADSKELS